MTTVKKNSFGLTLILTLLLFSSGISAQEEFNYDESKMPAFTLPDPLVLPNGRKVKSVSQWENKRKPQLLRMFENQMFGKIPEDLKISD